MTSSPPDWSPGQYLLFEAERTRPVRDLLAVVPDDAPIRFAADLGCGPGNSTKILAERWPGARIIGIDSSPAMADAARKALPGLVFDVADIARWSPAEPPGLILANASLQWLPDHARLLPRLLGLLDAGGTLAVQMPDNLDEPTHRLMREVAAAGPWAAKLRGAASARTEIASAAWYYALLRAQGAAVTIWRTSYIQPLRGGAGAVVDWFSSTGLRPFLAPLDDDDRRCYLDRYRRALEEVFPVLPGGEVLLESPRLFIVATLRNRHP